MHDVGAPHAYNTYTTKWGIQLVHQLPDSLYPIHVQLSHIINTTSIPNDSTGSTILQHQGAMSDFIRDSQIKRSLSHPSRIRSKFSSYSLRYMTDRQTDTQKGVDRDMAHHALKCCCMLILSALTYSGIGEGTQYGEQRVICASKLGELETYMYLLCVVRGGKETGCNWIRRRHSNMALKHSLSDGYGIHSFKAATELPYCSHPVSNFSSS